MRITKTMLVTALKETLNSVVIEASDKSPQPAYRKTFIDLLKKMAKGRNKNTPPFTKKPSVGKSGPVGMP
ncbi:MAG: hypothetical protein NZ811_02665 [Gammaproteobacteria bacterium]|nr:hypothetical protein [Gammaproteobacteria bacterium]